ncbi:11717_t:CDS:1 [Gigaspora margarita]|uniref:11717_t:CDS:1 n=1 Tax=Gigaspora margarita TaxID=4874 RepID=A0ABN7VMN2_GIGMA|nr:11717_t:CDS:1 [Gigaspora margarita]
MELFHYLSGGPQDIYEARKKLFKNLESIKEIILKRKFILFPSRPKSGLLHARNSEEYPARDGYENYGKLRIIARAILICKDLIFTWKKIGYHDIVYDVNDHVIQGTFQLLFPPIPETDYTMPNKSIIIKRL